ncbi:enoyl-CoA hydratase 2, peroxisomal-like [Panicum miliaceum]|uniref:Enoyl-CoA hydratase 2, peroxisomal-like n=1 Tax=Panicum miliaceum TaxID=4540 RepID=A0A3L6T3I7_PANMI|nr:enoyl-CoA hydratase 2, peroxisomal-like [Panicum miliaceum]
MATNSKPAAAVDPEVALAHRFPEGSGAVRALVGACGDDAVDGKELHFVYHRDGQPRIKVLPTFVSLFPNKNSNGLGFIDVPGLNFDASLLLHGQQYIEIYRAIPSSASVVNKVKVAGLHDKGKATILELETTTSLRESGEVLCMNRSTIYLRGAGGFSDSSRPYTYATYPANQALLYRLSGDYNPLHSDPDIAQVAGFTRPILHGLCTLGFAARAVIKSFCNGEPAAVKSIFGRVHYQTKVKERNRAVLSGYVLLQHIPSSL